MAINANEQHQQQLSLSDKIALKITNLVGTMGCVYLFGLLSLVALPAAISSHNTFIIVSWISQAFLQLVLLPLIIVGQNLQGQHGEIRAEAEYQATLKMESEVEHMQEELDTIRGYLEK